ncbi:MAG: porin family protein [bacterium]|nr:porin family protein [bacterium]
MVRDNGWERVFFFLDGVRQSAARPSRAAALVVLFCVCAAGPAAAQDADAAEGAAATADAAVEEISVILERLRREGAAAEEATQEATPQTAPSAEEAPPEDAAATDPTLEEAIDRAEASAERAEEAARVAREKAFEVKEALRVHRERFSRAGFYAGASGIYAVESFDAPSFTVDDSRGVAAFAGYRFHPHVGVEARGEILQGFDATAKDAATTFQEASLDGFLVTVGPKVYALTGAFQPYAGLGLGAIRAEVEGTLADGSEVSDRTTEAVVRPSIGLDFYLSENFVVNLDAAYVAPGGDLDGLDFGLFSAGFAIRF